MPSRLRLPGLVLLGAAFAFGSIADARAQALEKLNVLIFSPPSLGAFMPPIIKAQKLDQANGLDITFHERTPDAYTAQFNSGEFKVGGSASLQTIALADIRGVKVKYLFNLFDYWGTVVTSRPEIKTLKDLEGKQIAGARSTTNYVMFEFFAKRLGVDVSKFQVVNTAPPGLMSYALADRADAVQIWEPTYTLLVAKKPDCPPARHRSEIHLAGVRGRHPHSLPRRRRARGLGRPEPGARQEALCNLQSSRRMDSEEPGGGRAADGPAVHAGRCRRDGFADPRQRSARHQPCGRKRNPQGDRGRLQGRHRRRLFPQPCRRPRRSTTSRSSDPQLLAMISNPRVKQALQAAASTIVLLAAWQIASLFFPRYLFPSVPVDLLADLGHLRRPAVADRRCCSRRLRIFGGLLGAFLFGCLLAVIIGRSPFIESYFTPVLVFLQGIPALSWVVIAIIWFHGIEFRILFIMVITTLPAFTFQILDAYRSMSKDLFEMTMSFRPRGWTLFRVLIVPTIVPGILTAWKVNLGNAARVVVVAELVGATGGVGYQLLRQQQLFDMAGAIAWTLQLVLFVLVVQTGDRGDRELGAALPAGLRAGEREAVSADPFIRFDDVTKVFPRAGRQRRPSWRSTASPSRSRRARSSPCSARPAAASPPCSTCWPG